MCSPEGGCSSRGSGFQSRVNLDEQERWTGLAVVKVNLSLKKLCVRVWRPTMTCPVRSL